MNTNSKISGSGSRAAGRHQKTLAVAFTIVISLGVLLLPTPAEMMPEAQRLIAVTLLMAGLWVTQVIPLAATSLLPLAAFPLLGIQSAKIVSVAYINDNVFLYLGGFLIALGIERWHLHRRIALSIVRVVGASPKRLVLGFLIATAGLSMWISNTAAALLMLPIALALLQTLDDEQQLNGDADAGRLSAAGGVNGPATSFVAESSGKPPLTAALSVPLLLSIAYAASVGGMTTIIGTPTNTAAVAIYRQEFDTSVSVSPASSEESSEQADLTPLAVGAAVDRASIANSSETTDAVVPVRRRAADISVAQWMLASIPLGAIYLAVIWWVLTRGLPSSTVHDTTLRLEMGQRLVQLGRPSTAERRMFLVFVLTAFLWIFRRPLEVGTYTLAPGWSELSAQWFAWLGTSMSAAQLEGSSASFINDSTIAMLMAFVLFCIPSGTRDVIGRPVMLLDWQTATRLPWDIVLLIGGGFALAGAFSSTQLSEWLGLALQRPLSTLPPWLMIAVVCLLMTFLTEFTSNVATISTLLPTLCAICVALDVDPRLLIVPATLATSCAFMLPIATPPNAIVFGSGRIQIREMVGYGIFLNLVGIPILTVGTYLFIKPLMGIP